MNRLRPNLVVTGSAPSEEDNWVRVRVDEVTFRVVKPCARCAITTVDQDTGDAGREPLNTLATFRREGNSVMFRQNLVHDGPGSVAVGSPVEVWYGSA